MGRQKYLRLLSTKGKLKVGVMPSIILVITWIIIRMVTLALMLGTTKTTIPLTQCPDPSAFVEVSFSYERISEEFEAD